MQEQQRWNRRPDEEGIKTKLSALLAKESTVGIADLMKKGLRLKRTKAVSQ